MLVENLAKLGHSKRNATSVSLIVIAAIAMYNWVVTPHAASLSSARAYESTIDNMAKERRVLGTRVEIKRKKVQQLREQSAQIQSTLFTADQTREFFSDIEVISEQAGCTVHAVNLVGDGQKSKYENQGMRTVSAELNVVGLYKDITTLIRRLQAKSQKVWLDSLELKAVEQNSDRVGCRLTITICEIVDKDSS